LSGEAVFACGPYAVRETGKFHGDDKEAVVFRILLEAPGG
jgi:hypothetical protein